MTRPLPARLGRAAVVAALVTAPCAAIPAPAAAQDTTRAIPADSLRDRLRRLEEELALLRDQLATEAASGVQTATRVRAEIFGRVLTNGFHNSAAVNNADVPLFVLPSGTGRGGLGATIRQTSLGVSVAVERVLGGTFVGELHADFFGGQQPSTGGRHFPLPRIRTAHGRVRWARGELLVGQASPLVAEVDPVSLASFGTPGFTAAGNLWLWVPQLRGTVELGTPAGLALQGAVLAPTTGDAVPPFDTGHDAAEQSSRPALQLRVRSRWGEDDRAGEIGVGVHRGWLRLEDGRRATSEAVVASAVVPLGALVTVRGEAYAGQALRGLGGGGIGQNVSAAGRAVRDRGGWAQLDVRPSPVWQLGGGCGVADPRDADVPAGRRRNTACATHLLVRPGGPLVAGVEYRRLATRHADGTARNHHVNVAVGFEF